MLSLQPSTSLLGLGAVFVFIVILRIRAYRRLAHIPGPVLARWTDLWLIWSQSSGRSHDILADTIKKYGPIVRIGTDWVVVGDTAEVRKIWAVRSQWTRAPWYRGLRLDPYRDSTFSTQDEVVHEKLRAKLMPGYAGKDVDNLHALIDESVLDLVHLLESKYLSTDTDYRPVELASKIQYFTLDVISNLAFGTKLGYVRDDADTYGYIKTTQQTVPFLLTTCLMPTVVSIIQSPKLKWLLPDAESMVGIGTIMEMAREAVDRRFGPKAEVNRDMLGSFVAHGLTQQEAYGECITQIVAGSDTTATAIRSTLLFIMTSPRVYARFQAEIDQRVAAGQISSPITDAEAKRFPYLQAIIREGLRMYPPATGLLPKVSKKEEVVCGVRIPAGTNVAWAPWAIMRSTEVFGQDAEIFRPERWIEASDDRKKLMEQTVMLDFASGSRWECLGKNVAMIELNKTYVELLRRFDLTLVDPTNPWSSFNAAFFIQKDFNVRVTPRKLSNRST